MSRASRTHKGYQIRDWSGPYGQHPDRKEPKYFVQTQHHPTGIDWASEHCPQFKSLRAAREWIDMVLSAGGK